MCLLTSPPPIGWDNLADLAGRKCPHDLLIADITGELTDRPYEIVRVAGGSQFRTRPRHADTLQRMRRATEARSADLTEREALVLTIIAYRQPVTRDTIGRMTGRTVSRDLIARLHRLDLIARGPRSPEPGAPYTYVTTPAFLSLFRLDSLRDLPDLEALHDAGLLEDGGDMGMPVAGEMEE